MDTAIIPTGTIARIPTIDPITIMVGRHITGITGIESTGTIVIITTVTGIKLTQDLKSTELVRRQRRASSFFYIKVIGCSAAAAPPVAMGPLPLPGTGP